MENDSVDSLVDFDKAEAREIGEQNQDRCWILSDRDVWYRNPYYTGPVRPHPEEE